MEITSVKWKAIKGHEAYEVSNTGLVRVARTKEVLALKKGRRYFTTFCKVPLSRLVALAFLPNWWNKPNVIHIDGVQSNNSVENLRWATEEQTVLHNMKVTKLYNVKRCSNRKPVIATHKDGTEVSFSSIKECADCLCFHRRVIQDSLKHAQKQCANWQFRYAV